MSKIEWSPYLHIEELRPWPDAVHVVRGDERKLYLNEQVCYDQSDEIVRLTIDNEKMRMFALSLANVICDIGCDQCPYDDECFVETEPMRQGCQLYDELCSLGIEVD